MRLVQFGNYLLTNYIQHRNMGEAMDIRSLGDIFILEIALLLPPVTHTSITPHTALAISYHLSSLDGGEEVICFVASLENASYSASL